MNLIISNFTDKENRNNRFEGKRVLDTTRKPAADGPRENREERNNRRNKQGESGAPFDAEGNKRGGRGGPRGGEKMGSKWGHNGSNRS